MTTDITVPRDPGARAARVDAFLGSMTLREKAAQMTQIDCWAISPEEVAAHGIGSVLSGGGRGPAKNTPADWADMVSGFLDGASSSRLGVPLLYGIDAVHGHNTVVGAVVFPHNIGLGATGDPDLVARAARVTATELVATGIRWSFSPTVAVARDIRWGRTYEAFSEDPKVVAELGEASISGLQEPAPGQGLDHPLAVLACAKHFVGDGGTRWGSARPQEWVVRQWADADMHQSIDQGDADVDENILRSVHLPPYEGAIAAGVGSIMASYSSWQGRKLHGHRYLLTDVLKGSLGFPGLVVSDWMGIDQIDPDYDTCVVESLNAGLDMVMVPFDHQRFIGAVERAVAGGRVPASRIDDAVHRILTVKSRMGLLEAPATVGAAALEVIGSRAHRDVARSAVAASVVLLSNAEGLLPLSQGADRIVVAGEAADDLGMQCGGWTIEWQGGRGRITEGTTLVEALRQAAGEQRIAYLPDGEDPAEPDWEALIGIVVVGEPPYAEGVGDREDLMLPAADQDLVRRMRKRCRRLAVVVYSGRPLLLGEVFHMADAVVAAWLPGTEGAGLADVLLGARPFKGRLPFAWPRSAQQLPHDRLLADSAPPLRPAGFGLTT